jgi:hypothetical protein
LLWTALRTIQRPRPAGRYTMPVVLAKQGLRKERRWENLTGLIFLVHLFA